MMKIIFKRRLSPILIFLVVLEMANLVTCFSSPKIKPGENQGNNKDLLVKHLELKIKQLESRVEKLEFNQMKRTDQPISKELDSFYDKNETINCADNCQKHLLNKIKVDETLQVPLDKEFSLGDDPMTQENNDGDSSWAKLQISPNTLGSVPYGDFHIDIYEHWSNQRIGKDTSPDKMKNNNNKYYYAPISLLDSKSAESFFNNVTQQAEMTFRIELYNDVVQKRVTDWIKNEYDSTVKDGFVRVIPFEKVLLTSASTSFKKRYLLPDWIPYSKHKSIKFSLYCKDLNECLQLSQVMTENSEQFAHLRLMFSLNSQTSQTRRTLIHVESLMNGDLASKIEQRMPAAEFVLLTAKDEQRLLFESATNIIVDTFDDSEVFSDRSQSEAQIYAILRENLISSSKAIIKEQSDPMWRSVFWNEDNARPDVTSKAFNDVYSKLDSEKKKNMIDTFKNSDRSTKSSSEKFASGAEAIEEVARNLDEDFSREGSTTVEDVHKFLDEKKKTVQWDGAKFEPKPMSLSRINLSKLRDAQTFRDRTVRVKYSRAVLSVVVNLPQHNDVTSTNQLIEMQQKLINLENMTINLHQNLYQISSKIEDAEEQFQQKLTSITPPRPVAGSLPTSCSDYKSMGWTQNGFYTIAVAENVINSEQNRLATVYCDFSKATKYDTFVGYNNYKSKLVSFNVGGKSIYILKDETINPYSYKYELMNIGGGMNLSSGVFHAPVSGMYYFTLVGSEAWYNYFVVNTGGKEYSIDNKRLIIKLTKNDRVHLKLSTGDHLGTASGEVYFTGDLLSEDLLLPSTFSMTK